MTSKDKNKSANDNAQIKAFQKTARELEVDESEEAFEEAIRRVAKARPTKRDKLLKDD
jgi:hypothetical protein